MEMRLSVIKKILRSYNPGEDILGVEHFYSNYYNRDFIAVRMPGNPYQTEYLNLHNTLTGEYEGWVHFSDEGDPIINLTDELWHFYHYKKFREEEGLPPLEEEEEQDL